MNYLLPFLIPFVTALVFYPVLRSYKKSWHSLVWITAFFSIAIWALRILMEPSTLPPGLLALHLVGTLFGIVGVGIVAQSLTGWLETQSKSDYLFLAGKNNPRIHLRHLVKIAAIIEERGWQFYSHLAEKTSRPAVKKICAHLADEELRHKKIIDDMLSAWLSISIPRSTLFAFEKDLECRGLYLNPPPPDAEEGTMIRYAIEQEKKTLEFYGSFEKAFPRSWKRAQIHKLVVEEQEHIRGLADFLPASVPPEPGR